MLGSSYVGFPSNIKTNDRYRYIGGKCLFTQLQYQLISIEGNIELEKILQTPQ